jgi:hypothetical protein
MGRHYLLFSSFLIVCLVSTGLQRGFDQQQRAILEELFKVTNGHSWKNNAGWLSNTDLCQWYGVECDSDRKVNFRYPNCP